MGMIVELYTVVVNEVALDDEGNVVSVGDPYIADELYDEGENVFVSSNSEPDDETDYPEGHWTYGYNITDDAWVKAYATITGKKSDAGVS